MQTAAPCSLRVQAEGLLTSSHSSIGYVLLLPSLLSYMRLLAPNSSPPESVRAILKPIGGAARYAPRAQRTGVLHRTACIQRAIYQQTICRCIAYVTSVELQQSSAGPAYIYLHQCWFLYFACELLCTVPARIHQMYTAPTTMQPGKSKHQWNTL